MRSENKFKVLAICILLPAMVWLVFGQTLHFGFVNFDDPEYVYKNGVVCRGLTLDGVHWAFTHSHAGNWHPLTSLSHMLDCQIYGLSAGGHHFTNVLLHTASVILLFLVLRNMTGTLWSSALVAAVFAVHPLRAESVAWVSERKDVLSGLFFMLTLGAYARYARQPESTECYLTVVGLFALGLMAKPMLVTVPFVLLLLDYWPLQRFAASPVKWFGIPRRLILEKIPLVALAVLDCAITLMVQKRSIQPAETLPLPWCLANALNSYTIYLEQLFYPVGLAAYYPHNDPTNGWDPWKIILSLTLLAGISAVVFRERHRRPYLLVGWLWYLGMLLPVIGLVQAGTQAHADRYTYLPHIGLLILLVWGGAEWSVSWRHQRGIFCAGATVLLTVLILCARNQVTYWHDTVSLWTHTLACTPPNAFVEDSLGYIDLEAGQLDAARHHLQQAVDIEPVSQSYSAPYQNNLGMAVFRSGRPDLAVTRFRMSLGLDPDYAPAHNNLGTICFKTGRMNEAIAHFEAAIKSDPRLADAQNNLGNALMMAGRPGAAAGCYEKAIALDPNAYLGAYNNLAWVRATSIRPALRDGRQAVQAALQANQLSGGTNMMILRTLAAAYAEAGQFPQAVEVVGQALQLATAQNNWSWIVELGQERRIYQSGQPIRDAERTFTSGH